MGVDAGFHGRHVAHYFGYPLRAGARYFPGVSTPGFLLSVFSMKLQVLPAPFNERRDKLWMQSLASISPDQKSFAYVDDLDDPSNLLPKPVQYLIE